MTQNPFGEGGFDLNALMEQAQQMQSQLMAAQEQLAETTVDGSAGGVTVTLTGTGELTGVVFGAGSVEGTDEESLTDVGDLVVAAYRDAKSKVDDLAAQALGPMGGGLGGGLGGAPGGAPGGGLPGGFGV
jgi:DNA-binding protein YbaB